MRKSLVVKILLSIIILNSYAFNAISSQAGHRKFEFKADLKNKAAVQAQNGTIIGEVTFPDTSPKGALIHNGGIKYLHKVNLGEFTIKFRFRPLRRTDKSREFEYNFIYGTDASGKQVFRLRKLKNKDYIQFVIRNETGKAIVAKGRTPWLANKWCDIKITASKTAKTVKLYFRGREIACAPMLDSIQKTMSILYIGSKSLHHITDAVIADFTVTNTSELTQEILSKTTRELNSIYKAIDALKAKKLTQKNKKHLAKIKKLYLTTKNAIKYFISSSFRQRELILKNVALLADEILNLNEEVSGSIVSSLLQNVTLGRVAGDLNPATTSCYGWDSPRGTAYKKYFCFDYRLHSIGLDMGKDASILTRVELIADNPKTYNKGNTQISEDRIQIYFSDDNKVYQKYTMPWKYKLLTDNNKKTKRIILDKLRIQSRYVKIHENVPVNRKADFVMTKLNNCVKVYGVNFKGKKRDKTLTEKISRVKISRNISAQIITKNKDFTVWTQNNLERVFKHDKVKAVKKSNVIKIFAAKNEYEPFQIIIQANQGISDKLFIKTGNLYGKNTVISENNLKFNPEHYIYLPVKSVGTGMEWAEKVSEANKAKRVNFFEEGGLGAGYYPDPLLNEKSIVIKTSNEKINYPIWFTLYVPPKTQAGDYNGEIIISSAGGLKAKIKIQLTVWDFTLPKVPSMKTIAVASYNRHSDTDLEQFKPWFENMVKHRISGIDRIFPKPRVKFLPDGTVKLDTRSFDEIAHYALDTLAMNAFFMPHVTVYQNLKSGKWLNIKIFNRDKSFTEEFKLKFTAYLRAMSKHLEQKGWMDKVLLGSWDEPSPNNYPILQKYAKLVRQANPKLKIFCTEQIERGLEGAVDIWCSGRYVSKDVVRRQKKGEQFWIYHNSYHLTDYPLTSIRVMPWIMWRYKIEGQLLWRIDSGFYNWMSPWLLVTWDPPTHVRNGCGQFLYPDPSGLNHNNYTDIRWNKKKHGRSGPPVNSIRWEILREGLEDYDYLRILEQRINLGQKHWVTLPKGAKEKVKKAQQFLKTLQEEMVQKYEYNPQTRLAEAKFNKSPKAFFNARKNIAKHILDLNCIFSSKKNKVEK